MDITLNWPIIKYIEVLGILTSFIYIYFQIKQNILLWLFGLISSGIYIYIFFDSKIYADMGLQFYYVLVSIYGWIHWSSIKEKSNSNNIVRSVLNEKKLSIYLIIASVLLFVCLSQFLINFTDSNIPYLDALTTALSIVATWMLAKRYIEHWLIWIFVDALSSGIYVYKELYFTVFLYIVFTVMAFVGYKAWLKDAKLRMAE